MDPVQPTAATPSGSASADASPAPRTRTLTNALATLFGRGLGQFTRLIAYFVMIKHLSPEVSGIFGLLLAALDISRVMTNFGFDNATIRRMATLHGSEGAILRMVQKLKTGTSVVGLVVLGAYALMIGRGLHASTALVLFPLQLLALTWAASLTARFQAAHMMHWLIPVQAVVGSLYLAAVYLAAQAGAQLPGFITLLVAAEFATWIAAELVRRRLWPAETRATSHPPLPFTWQTFVKESLPLGIFDALVIAYARVGMFLVAHAGSMGKIDSGHLYTAIKTNEYTIAFAGALAASTLPVFSLLVHQRQPDLVRIKFLKYSGLGLGLSVSAAIFLTLFGRALLTYKSPANAAAAEPLKYLAWAGVAMFQNNLSSSVLYAFGHFRRMTVVAFTNFTLYVLIGLVLIPSHHAIGAAVTSVITEWTAAIIYLTLVFIALRSSPQAATLESVPLGQVA